MSRRCAIAVAVGLVGGCDESAAPWSTAPMSVEPQGEVVFVEEHGPPEFRIASLDLEDGTVTTRFSLPSGAFAYDVVANPIHGGLVISYTAPPQEGEVGFDRSALFELTDEGPAWLAGDDIAGHWALEPTWSADGETLWYVHVDDTVVPTVDDASMVLRAVEPGTGRVVRQIAWATEPAVSPDGEHMAYVQLELGTWVRNVVLATATGEPIRTLVHADDVYDLGLPHWSADGSTLYVAILEDPDAEDVGLRSAELAALPETSGHGVHLSPADWFALDLENPTLRPASALSTILYDASLPDNGDALLTATREGIERVSLADGTAERLLDNRAIRSLTWRP